MALDSQRKSCLTVFFSGHSNFLALLLTTPISTLLLYWSLNDILFSGSLLHLIERNRPTVQFAVQLAANLLSLCQVLVLCRLINYGVRRHLASKSMTLDALRAWIDAMTPRLNWDLPFQYFVPLGALVALSMILSALWAAALTPVELWDGVDGTVDVPSWENYTLLREYPSELTHEGPTVQNLKGRFSYSVGTQLLGSLLASASSATPIDGSPRVHAKIDKSKFTYIGRSYGVGASVGLVDDTLQDDSLALGYAYQEVGYHANVKCLYNESSEFVLEPTGESWVYAATGPLPDSNAGPEYSNYIGHFMDRIVAIGVAHFANTKAEGTLPLRRYLAFATGSDYDFLDKIQCDVDFVPTRFNLTVDFRGQNITVEPTNDAKVDDINPSRHLKGAVMRQFELIANDETNIYISTVGSAFNASIADLRTFKASSDMSKKLTESEMVLRGVENSITVMTDDMLGAYASAQLMVSDFKQATSATVRTSAIAFGGTKFSIAVFCINVAVILLLLIEVMRTRAWKDLPDFDVADVRHLVIAASEGGAGLGNFAFGQNHSVGDIPFRYARSGGGRFAMVADETKDVWMIEHMSIVTARKNSIAESDNFM